MARKPPRGRVRLGASQVTAPLSCSRTAVFLTGNPKVSGFPKEPPMGPHQAQSNVFLGAVGEALAFFREGLGEKEGLELHSFPL